jgi:hypothetical protein
MKFSKYFVGIISGFFIICSCEQTISPFADSRAKMKAKVLNPKDTVSIGDSVIVLFNVLDTVLVNDSLTALYSKEQCTVSCAYNKVDSNQSIGYIDWTTDGTVYTNPGKLGQNGDVYFAKVGNKLYTRYAFIPKAKGVYFLECRFNGALEANNGNIKTLLVYDFDVPDKHLDLLRKAAGSKAAKLEPWIQNCENTGKGLYVFAVK